MCTVEPLIHLYLFTNCVHLWKEIVGAITLFGGNKRTTLMNKPANRLPKTGMKPEREAPAMRPSGESTRFPPMKLRFDSWTWHQTWIEFDVISRPFSQSFLPVLWFPPLHKNQHSESRRFVSRSLLPYMPPL